MTHTHKQYILNIESHHIWCTSTIFYQTHANVLAVALPCYKKAMFGTNYNPISIGFICTYTYISLYFSFDFDFSPSFFILLLQFFTPSSCYCFSLSATLRLMFFFKNKYEKITSFVYFTCSTLCYYILIQFVQNAESIR